MPLPESLYFVDESDFVASSTDSVTPSESTIRLRQYLELRSKQLKLDLEAAALFTGKTETGTVTEDAIRRFLKSSLPARYSVGLGEVISTKNKINNQTQSKDVIIYDSAYSPIFGWGETGFHLFPIESVYAIIEVKKTIDTAELLKGIKQAIEAKQLNSVNNKNPERPFTAVIAFNSKIRTETLAKHISKLHPKEIVDFVLILKPKLGKRDESSENNINSSDYIAHWYYRTPEVGGGPVEFKMAHQAAAALEPPTCLAGLPLPPSDIYLTWGRSNHALMWFYLFLISSINAMKTQKPNLWKYTGANKTNLGYRGDPSNW